MSQDNFNVMVLWRTGSAAYTDKIFGNAETNPVLLLYPRSVTPSGKNTPIIFGKPTTDITNTPSFFHKDLKKMDIKFQVEAYLYGQSSDTVFSQSISAKTVTEQMKMIWNMFEEGTTDSIYLKFQWRNLLNTDTKWSMVQLQMLDNVKESEPTTGTDDDDQEPDRVIASFTLEVTG